MFITSNLLAMALVETSRSSNHWPAATETLWAGVPERGTPLWVLGCRWGGGRIGVGAAAPGSQLPPCSLEVCAWAEGTANQGAGRDRVAQ